MTIHLSARPIEQRLSDSSPEVESITADLDEAVPEMKAVEAQPEPVREAVDPMIERHLAHCRLRRLRPSTIHARRRLLGELTRDLGTPLLSVTGEQLLNWQLERPHLAAQSVVTYRNHAVGFYLWAQAQGLRADNPAERMARPKLVHALPNPIDEDDLALAILCAVNDRLRLWIVLGGYCGLRVSEIAGLRREHIRETAPSPHLIVFDGKGGKQRIVPLAAKVLEELGPWLARGVGPMFTRADSPAPVPPCRVGQQIGEHLHKLAIPHSAHALRHRFGTQMYAKTHDLLLVGRLMGHANPQTTAGYVAVAADVGAKAVELL